MFFIKTDFTNAFNTFNRDIAINNISEEIPKLAPFIKKIYGQPNKLLFDHENSIDSTSGAQQGCPCGPLLFCFSFKPVLDILQSEFPRAHIKAYIDDNTIAIRAPPGIVLNLLHRFEALSNKVNLMVNTKKSDILIPSSIPYDNENIWDFNQTSSTRDLNRTAQKLLASVQRQEMGYDGIEISIDDFQTFLTRKNYRIQTLGNMDSQIPVGIDLLGAPLGNNSFKVLQVQSVLQKYIKNSDCIHKLDSHQKRWNLLLYVLQAKLTHLFRTVSPEITTKLVEPIIAHDNNLLLKIFKLEPFDNRVKNTFLQNSLLKINHGGTNRKNYKLLSFSAYLGSVLTIYSEISEEFSRKRMPMSQSDIWEGTLTNVIKAFETIGKEAQDLQVNVIESETYSHPTGETTAVAADNEAYKEMEGIPITVTTYLRSLMHRDESDISTYVFKKLQKKLYDEAYKKHVLQDLRPNHPEVKENGKAPPHEQYYAGKWLLMPSFASTALTNDDFYLMSCRKFRIPFIPEGTKCSKCNKEVDAFGDHIMLCKYANWILRHNNCVNLIGNSLKHLKFCVQCGEIPMESFRLQSYREILVPPEYDGNTMDTSSILGDETTEETYIEEARDNARETEDMMVDEPQEEDRTDKIRHTNREELESTQGSRIDIYAKANAPMPNKEIYADVQIIGAGVNKGKIDLEGAEARKKQVYEEKVKRLGGNFWAPTFDCYGNSSATTEKIWKGLFDEYAKAQEEDERKRIYKKGRTYKYWAILNSFEINKYYVTAYLKLIQPVNGRVDRDTPVSYLIEMDLIQRYTKQYNKW